MPPRPFTVLPIGIKTTVKLTPKASRDRVHGVVEEADGTSAIKVSVTAPPEDGKANRAMIKLLSKTWGVPKSNLFIAAGGASRRKALVITGDTEEVGKKLDDWLEGSSDV